MDQVRVQGGNRGSVKWHAEHNKGLKSCFFNQHSTQPPPSVSSSRLYNLFVSLCLNFESIAYSKISNQMLNDSNGSIWGIFDNWLILSWVLLKLNKNVKVINTKNIKEQTAMALKVSQTKKSYNRANSKEYIGSCISFKKHMWSSSRNATHTHYKTFWFLLASRGFFSPPQQKQNKKKISSANHMHLFTSKSLSQYETTNRWGTRGGGQGKERGHILPARQYTMI